MVNLQIIGVQKAGTTALAKFLSKHPQIYLVDGKEAHVFDHPQFHLQANKQRQARLRYQKKMSKYRGERYICDATPITIYRSQYLEYCVNYNPEAKFIVLLRDPVERAVSHYRMSRSRGIEKRCMLMAFLLEPLRIKQYAKQSSWFFDSPARTYSYLSRGFYKQQLYRLMELVPEDNLLILQQEYLLQNHNKVLSSVFKFLGIDNIPIPTATHFKQTKDYTHWSDPIARLYAKCIFSIKKEL